MKKLLEIHCWDCRLRLEPDDVVNMDEIYTLTHDFCNSMGFKIEDTGTYEEIAKRHPYYYKK